MSPDTGISTVDPPVGGVEIITSVVAPMIRSVAVATAGGIILLGLLCMHGRCGEAVGDGDRVGRAKWA